MPSLSERHRNNVRAGVFVTIAMLIGLFVMIQVSGVVQRLSQTTTPYRVSFSVMAGIGNLKSGSEVRVGGVPMGRVSDIEPQLPPELPPDQPFNTIMVDFKVDTRVTLYSNATILIGSPLLGSDSWLDIPNVGNPGTDKHTGKPTTRIEANGVIQGSTGAGMLTTLLGVENKERASEFIENFRVVSVNAKEFSDVLPEFESDYHEKIEPVFDNLKAFSDRFPGWGDRVDQVMQWAVDAGPKIDAAIAKGDDMLTQGRDMVVENRPNIKEITDNFRITSERINNETIEKVHQLLDKGQQGVDQAVALIETLRVDYNIWATDVGEALANANLGSQQLKLAMIEVRRSPWKVLYRPSEKEVEHELLYDATRSFAIAAADLKASSESVQRIVKERPALLENPENKEAFQRLTANLLKSLATYEKAQQQLLDVLISKP